MTDQQVRRHRAQHGLTSLGKILEELDRVRDVAAGRLSEASTGSWADALVDGISQRAKPLGDAREAAPGRPVLSVCWDGMTPPRRQILLMRALFLLGLGRSSVYVARIVHEIERFLRSGLTDFRLSSLRARWDQVPVLGAPAEWAPRWHDLFTRDMPYARPEIPVWQDGMWIAAGAEFQQLLLDIKSASDTTVPAYVFLGNMNAIFDKIPGFKDWHKALDMAELISLLQESYQHVEDVVGRTPPSLAPVYRIWYHELGNALLAECALRRFRARNERRLILTARSSGSFFTKRPRRVAAQLRTAIARAVNAWHHRGQPRVRAGRSIYVLIEGSETQVNLRSGRALLRAFERAGEVVTVLTSSRRIEAAMRADAIPAAFVGDEPEGTARDQARRVHRYLRLHRFAASERHTELERSALRQTVPVMAELWETALLRKGAIRTQFQRLPPSAFIALGESHPASILAGMECRRHRAPWIGWNHLLIMDTKDNCYFPAQHHLFYGEHGLDIFRRSRRAVEPSLSVGSPNFDEALSRAKPADLEYVKKLLPRWQGEQLVVVGTENRQGQEAEILPTLTRLVAMTGVHTVLKLHPDDPASAFADMVARVDPGQKAVTMIGKCDLLALLNSADLLITQYSNIVISAAMLGTPVLVYDFDDSRPLDFVREGIANPMFSPAAIDSAITTMLKDPEARSRRLVETAQNISRFIHRNDGKSADRVVAYVRQCMQSVDGKPGFEMMKERVQQL